MQVSGSLNLLLFTAVAYIAAYSILLLHILLSLLGFSWTLFFTSTKSDAILSFIAGPSF